MVRDAANGSPPTVCIEPSGAGRASTCVFCPGAGRATLLALPVVTCALTCWRTAPWSYIPFSSSGSIPPDIAGFCLDKLLAVSTRASSQSAFPGSAAGFCHAEVTSLPPFEGKASHEPLLPPAAGGPWKRARASLLPCSSALTVSSLRSTKSPCGCGGGSGFTSSSTFSGSGSL
uniref:Uncharacterized protein n=1 Tax=Arundo donax TaxID=35708 RepID=A0A0A9EW89_ARUDO